jgi:hypothetical protein
LLAVTFDIEAGDVEEVGIVAEQTEALVAPLAEQLSDSAVLVIVIKVLRFRVRTDAASVLLRLPQRAQFLLTELVLPIEVGIPACGAFAGLAPTRQARHCATAPVEVLVRDRLLARRTPTKSFGNPRMVSDGLPHGLTALAVMRVALRPVTGQAVEGQPVPEGAVPAELRSRLRFPARGASLHRFKPAGGDYRA